MVESANTTAVMQDLVMLQRMVDMRITSLEGLRKDGSSGSDIILHEIRTVEVRIIISIFYPNPFCYCIISHGLLNYQSFVRKFGRKSERLLSSVVENRHGPTRFAR